MVESYQARPFFNAGRGDAREVGKGRGEPDYPFFTLPQASPSIYTKGETPSTSTLKGASSYPTFPVRPTTPKK